ncbi:MAG TPA: hypothetical protein VLA34_08660, partial [Candidatus Krumholzibacterium sp.]|nr:hypothetical protein [Candidatus Krumholzibacterium sp.]
MGKDSGATFFYGIVWSNADGDGLPPELCREAAHKLGHDTAGMEDYEVQDACYESGLESLGDYLDLFLGLKPRGDYENYATYLEAKRKAQLDAFGMEIRISFVGDLEFDDCSVPCAFPGDENAHVQPDWTSFYDVGEIIRRALVDDNSKKWEIAMQKVGDLLPGS